MSSWTFSDRVRYAERGLLRNEDSRKMDGCFESGDGAAVCLMLMRLAEINPDLAEAVNRVLAQNHENKPEHPWARVARQYKHIPTCEIAKLSRQMLTECRKERARSTSLYYSNRATEPTEAGLQYVMPGCEKDRSRGPVQTELF